MLARRKLLTVVWAATAFIPSSPAQCGYVALNCGAILSVAQLSCTRRRNLNLIMEFFDNVEVVEETRN